MGVSQTFPDTKSDRTLTGWRKSLLTAVTAAGGMAVLAAGSTSLISVHEAKAQSRQQVSYAQDLVPIFRGYCNSCHQPGGEGYKASGFDLTTYQGLMKGTKFGTMIIPGEPDMSNLIVIINGRAATELRMPHNLKPLPNSLRQTIWRWIFQGAKDN